MKTLIQSVTITLACLSCLNAAELKTDGTESPESTDGLLDLNSNGDASADMSIGNEALFNNTEATSEPAGAEVLPDKEMALAPMQKPRPFSFRIKFSSLFDDNLFIQKNDKQSDFIWSISPGITLGIGDLRERKDAFIVLNYDANAYFFTDHSDLNSVDHDASLLGQWAGSKLKLGTALNFHDLTGTNNETADRVNRKLYEASITATYVWSEKTTLGADLSEHISDYKNNLDTQETSLRTWADYEIGPLTKLGLGVTLGQVDVSEGRLQTFEQLLARVNYAAGSKVDLVLQAGGELRQVEDGNSSATPVFSLQGIYSPYERLHVRLDGYRRVQPSIVDIEANTVVTGVSLNLTYQFLQRLETSASGAYENSGYEGLGGAESASRTDNYFLIRASQSYSINQHTRIGAFYQFRTNSSTQTDRSFNNQQVGVEFTFAF